jgi:hypothetical protein
LSRESNNIGGNKVKHPSSAESSLSHHDLNQEWEKIDELAPWAEDEIDRLQEKLNLPNAEEGKS